MIFKLSSSLFLTFATLETAVVVAQECPPPGLVPLPNFDFEAFVSEPYFAVKLQPTFLFNPSVLFCERLAFSFAQDQSLPRFCDFLPFLCVEAFESQVFLDSVGSVSEGVGGESLSQNTRFISSDPNGSAIFKNGFSFLPPATYSDFAIVAAGTFDDLLDETLPVSEFAPQPSSNVYDWIIFSIGGLPGVDTGNGCVPGLGRFDTSSYALSTREQIPPQLAIDRLVEIADFIGFDTSILLDVVQEEGCVFPPLP